ncbi:MAG TPA: ribose-phosphate pyrophosphokinase-like domain-containing protein, partial [Patescibacteria group bacterium]|nr:ribose-phosphate pyrophosphokinase-like domain-containing protein [Patescibacteria group bacterium]
MSNKDDFILLTGRANPELAKAIGKILEVPVDEPVSVFADGEIRVRINSNVRRRMVVIIQPTSTP